MGISWPSKPRKIGIALIQQSSNALYSVNNDAAAWLCEIKHTDQYEIAAAPLSLTNRLATHRQEVVPVFGHQQNDQ
jgi:hypothetical protein